MPDDNEIIHQLDDFIQQRALGGLIRQWFSMNEQEMTLAMNAFRTQSSANEVESMTSTLLHVAAGYPSCAVRRKLVQIYGVFVQGGG